VAKFDVIKESLAGALKSGTNQIKQGNPGIMDKYAPPEEKTSEGDGTEQIKWMQ
jgi:hypothetical protein